MRTLLLVALAVLIAGALLIGRGAARRETRALEPAPLPDRPTAALEVLAAHAFVADEPFVHEWRAEKPLERAGYLLALRVAPELARPRQTYEPVLYVGAQTAERCNAAWEGDVLVVLVPAPLDARGQVQLDLARAPIWFGSPELPERVDEARVRAELARAHAEGIGPVHLRPEAARLASADAIRVGTRADLEPYVEDLLARFTVPLPR